MKQNLLVIAGLLLFGPGMPLPAETPNVIFILMDDMGYGVGVYWYGDADTTSNRKPDPEGALMLPPLPDASQSATAPSPSKKTGAFKDAVECETMTVASKSHGLTLKTQALKRFKGAWSGGQHVLVKNARVGDTITFRFPAQSPVAEKLILHGTRSFDFGTLRFKVNGKPAGKDVDLYASRPVPSGPIELGTFAPDDGAYVLQVQVVGKHPKSRGALFGLDCIILRAAQ